jgi:Fe-Mn family superoxide dismutase
MTFELPDLPYAHDALAPYMSQETLEYHHDKHHLAYVNKGNDKIKGTPAEGKSLEEAMVWAYQNDQGLFNNLGQHFNHMHFWKWMKPNGGGSSLPGSLESKINEDIGGFDAFKDKFISVGGGQFGSGWVWLAQDNNSGKLEIVGTPNGENPVVHGKTPLLGCDVWEHSYYIDYRNARPKYLEAFVDNLINWDYVAELYEAGPIKAAA